ncbi:AbgT family transporter [Jatrophihabitans sp. DSM 45814]
MAESTDLTADSEDAGDVASKRGIVQKMLDGIEVLGNKVPHPAIIFLYLCGLVIVLSQILYLFNVHAKIESTTPIGVEPDNVYPGGSSVLPPGAEHVGDYHTHTEIVRIEGLLTVKGLRFIFTSAVTNFTSFGVVGVILVAMIGVGVAEEAGLIAALIRKLVKVAPRPTITFIIVLLGIISSIASDAGYLVLIPLGAAAFVSLGRHPLAGLAAAFAGVGGAFGVNVLITPVDAMITEITNQAIHTVNPNESIDLTANLYFSIVSTFFLAFLITIVTTRIVEPRLGKYEGTKDVQAEVPIDPADESRGLRYALWGLLATLAALVALTAPSGAPLRNPETGAIIGDSPLMESLIFIISIIFLVVGLCYGVGARTMRGSVPAVAAVVKTYSGLSGMIFMLLIISQFLAYFNYSNMAQIAAVKLADALERANIGAIWLLILLIMVTFLLDLIIPGVVPKWAILAPIFIPLMIRLGVAPQTVLAAYRVGDSPFNVVTPLMVYLAVIVVFAQKYRKDAGIGTVVSLMIPYAVIIAIGWLIFFVIWYFLGIPLGPGYPVKV